MKMPRHHLDAASTATVVAAPAEPDPKIEAIRAEFLAIVAEVKDLSANLAKYSPGLDI